MTPPKIRERAYALVKKLKKAWTIDGCDIQVAVEQALVEQRDDIEKYVAEFAEKKRDEGYGTEGKVVRQLVEELKEAGLL